MVRPLSGIALRERALGALTLAWVAQALTNPSEAAAEVALAVLLVSAAEPGASDAERPWVLVFREIED